MNADKKQKEFRSAFVALVGRPNCGKSTLLNTICGEELSIVTSLPQTTRRNFRGIYTDESRQIVFVDTPGIHYGKHVLNKSMYEQGIKACEDGGIDIVCYMVDMSRRYGDEEAAIAKIMAEIRKPSLLVFNKSDCCGSPGRRREEFFENYPQLKDYPGIILSAKSLEAKEIFLSAVFYFMKPGPAYYGEDELTTANMRFLASEIIRKQIIEMTREEVPHAVCVEIISYKETESKHEIHAAVHVETQGQKAIIIGAKGKLIKMVKNRAQKNISRFVHKPVSVLCHVRVTPKWRDNRRFLKEMGMV